MALINMADMNTLIAMLKANCPVDTGNLRENGIQGTWLEENGERGFIITIGTKAGVPSTDTYAWFTNYYNKTSLGWVDRTVQQWCNQTELKVSTRVVGGNDFDVE